jgi:ubiquinone/menaquinone biosynthesis C-methylase UbiE
MLTAVDISQMPYQDFVALLEQDNAPPGGEPTIVRWIDAASITSRSRVLDLACSTGLSGRTIAARTRCRVFGVDLSAAAIAEASRKAAAAGLTNVAFQVMDATALGFSDAAVDIVVAGSCFGFIRPPEAALKEVHRVLDGGGRLCIANFVYHRTPPGELLDRVALSAGFRPREEWSKVYWDEFFGSGFELAYEEAHQLEPLDRQDIALAVGSFVTRHTGKLGLLPAEVKEVAFRRLLVDRLVFNEHRRFQTRNVQVWQRR